MFGQVAACRDELMWLCTCLAHKPSLFKVLPLCGLLWRRGPALRGRNLHGEQTRREASGKIVRVPSPQELRFLGPKL